MFNLFNHTNFTAFIATKYTIASSSFDANANVTINLADAPTFLTPTAASNTLFGARDAQIGVKFMW